VSFADGLSDVGRIKHPNVTKYRSTAQRRSSMLKMPAPLPSQTSMLVALLLASGCGTAMLGTRLQTPVRTHAAGLELQVSEVHLSRELRRRDFSASSRVLVVLDLVADSDTELDLHRARLSIGGAERTEQPRTALASGVGEAPVFLRDGEHAPVLYLRRGEHVRAWVAFGQFHDRASREIPERVKLELPHGLALEVSRPGEAPVWTGQPVVYSASMGTWFQGSADESTLNWLLEDYRYAVGPVVLAGRLGLGGRVPQVESGRGQNFVCCNIALATDVAWPLLRTKDLTLGPYAGVEAALLMSNDTVTRRTWVGPALGLELAIQPLLPRHGPFPVSYPRSSLGAYTLRLALVHWFGPDRDLPSFGVTSTISMAIGD
jgi:hypothetical protein